MQNSKDRVISIIEVVRKLWVTTPDPYLHPGCTTSCPLCYLSGWYSYTEDALYCSNTISKDRGETEALGQDTVTNRWLTFPVPLLLRMTLYVVPNSSQTDHVSAYGWHYWWALYSKYPSDQAVPDEQVSVAQYIIHHKRIYRYGP